jgi:hypothetical protein
MGSGIFSVHTTRFPLRYKLRQVLSQSENTCTHKRSLIDREGPRWLCAAMTSGNIDWGF